jgi:hypothetical protein
MLPILGIANLSIITLLGYPLPSISIPAFKGVSGKIPEDIPG